MTALTPRLAPIFEKTKTVCFGRFLIDVPESTTVAWGGADIPLRIEIYPYDADKLADMTQAFITDLKNTKAIYHKHEPLLLAVEDLHDPEGKIVTGYENFEAINALKINTYFKLDTDGVIISAHPLQANKDRAIARMTSMARRLRQRIDNEIPVSSGNCIERAFLSDEPDNKTSHAELIRIGFRLKEFPDTHLSISIGPSNPHYSESNSLQWQLDQREKGPRAQPSEHPHLQAKYLRRGERHIHNWLNGFEALSVTPEQPAIHSIHDFAMDVRGVPSDPFKPYVDIRMQTGVADNAAGATKASLTDEEAIAVWDKITSTIRVRPTTAMPAKSADTDWRPRIPLGELAATGRTCPQTGWWQPNEAPDEKDTQRQHIKAGERMPHVVALGEPSLWEKLKGERPTYRTATVWKLVSYGDPPAVAGPGTVVAKNESDNAAGDHPNDNTPSQHKG